jgi:glutamate racemase
MKIGLFDSGRGGLLVATTIRDNLPDYSYLYYGDTAHVPYGDRSESEILNLTKIGIEYLFTHDCLLVIVACNTASVQTLRKLQNEWLPVVYPDRKVLGVIIPTIEAVLETSCTTILLLATTRTVHSKKYQVELLKKKITDVKIIAQAAPTLVPLLEAGDILAAVESATLLIATNLAQDSTIDAVILGCTHYSIIVFELRQRFPDIKFFAQTEVLPKKVQSYLHKHTALQTQLDTDGTFTTFFTGKNY